ncbi:variant leucine-rich repeat-containing protein [Leucobacter sp. USHLN153]|uniref:variant leucine-rich repeat-containing protein n=1 Tax=Leucobacter sp. USHLN153 TaxID=3081268 RepID=UPI003015DC34
MSAKMTQEAALGLLKLPSTPSPQLAEIAARFVNLREHVVKHPNASSVLKEWIERQDAHYGAARDSIRLPQPKSPKGGDGAGPHSSAGAGGAGSSALDWERRLADKEAERLQLARIEAEEDLKTVVHEKRAVESEIDIIRQSLHRVNESLSAEQVRLREAERQVGEEAAARAEFDDVVKILRTNLVDLEYVLEQETLAHAQAENRLARLKLEVQQV